jgi:hypothetical protein
MGLGVWFNEDIAHVLRGVGEGVSLLVAQRGLRDAADAAYVAGYWAALRAVATSLGLGTAVSAAPPGWLPEFVETVWEGEQ